MLHRITRILALAAFSAALVSPAVAETQLDRLCNLQAEAGEVFMEGRQLGAPITHFNSSLHLPPLFVEMLNGAWAVPVYDSASSRALAIESYGLDVKLACYHRALGDNS
jgi:hypothetical protein